MALYRGDVQYAMGTDLTDTGFYWGVHAWYFEAMDSAEYALAKEGCIRATAETLNVNAILWYQLWREWPGGTVVEATNVAWPHPDLSGPYGPLWNTVYVALLNGDRQVSYKRVRSPLRIKEEGYNPVSDFEDGRLTDATYAFYQDKLSSIISDYPYFRNSAGVPIDGVRVRREVSDWQLRHGTKRRNKQRIWLVPPYIR